MVENSPHERTGVSGGTRFSCSLVRLGFVYTLKIVARILSDRANRDRLCFDSATWDVNMGLLMYQEPVVAPWGTHHSVANVCLIKAIVISIDCVLKTPVCSFV